MKQHVDIGTLFSAIKADIEELITTRIKLVRLEVFEKVSTVGGFVFLGVIMINILFFALLFGFLALGFLFSEWVGTYAGGFGLVVALYALIFGILFLCRRRAINWFANILLDEMAPELKEEDQLS